jgi:NAD(P)-dependent dehydrogenase (short-subunit alcohol dehydrogenase family)
MTKGMQGKVALVTGGASGIGRITAQAFAGEGVKVIVATDANVKGAEETIRLIKDSGGEATFIKCDVKKAEEVESMVSRTVETYGSLDYAFNNAGIGPDGKRVPVFLIPDCPEEIWDRTLDTNLKGVWLCMKYEIRQMIKQKRGVIVNTSSVGALRPIPGFGPYAASKGGLIVLTKTAAMECAPFGIRVNVICPGLTARTQLAENISSANPEEREQMLKPIPMARMGEPEEMAEAVLWLCSDSASFITGHVMPIDGGLSAT